MIALDTNVIVRGAAGDEPEQVQAAARVMREDILWLPKTVLLEAEWVLRYSYRFDRDKIVEIFQKLLGLENVVCEDRAAVGSAISWFSEGMDFADALHLASSKRADELVTFDREFAKDQERVGASPSVRLL